MGKIHLYIIVFFLFVSCATHTNDFRTYASQIETLPTPLTFRTTEFFDQKLKDKIDESLFNKYKYAYADNVYGKIWDTDSSVTILYLVNGDIITPVLVTYDKEGNKIDSLNLFENASGFNLEKETYVTATCYFNKTIQEIDSISTWTLNDKMTDRIQGSEKKRVDSIMYFINGSGKIISNKHD